MLLTCLTASDLHSSLATINSSNQGPCSLLASTLFMASKASCKITHNSPNKELARRLLDLLKCSDCLSMELWLPDGFKFAFHMNNILPTNRENVQRNVKMLPSKLIQTNRKLTQIHIKNHIY